MSLIDEYLDQLSKQLPSRGNDWRLVMEARDHLLETVAVYEKHGMPRRQAEKKAIKEFGPVKHIVKASVNNAVKSGQLLGEMVQRLWLVVSVFCVALGVSGLMALLLGTLWGQGFISGDAPGVTYTAARCGDYLRLVPEATSCSAAAVTHHYWEIIDLRIFAGIVGLFGLVSWWFGARRLKAGRLPNVVWLGILLAVSGTVAAAGLFLGVLPLLFGPRYGAGAMLSVGLTFGVVSLVVAMLFWQQSRQFSASR